MAPRVFDEVASRGYSENMRAVGLKTLKNKLSEYVRLAAGGDTVLVGGWLRGLTCCSPRSGLLL